MTLEDIKKGESDILEFKRELPSKDSKLMKTVVAFANSHGGKIIFGIDDETLEILGIENDKVFKLRDSLTDMICNNIEPQVNPRITFETIEDKTLVVVEIFPGRNQPYFLKSEGILDGVYIRVAATSRQAEKEKVRELMLLGEGKSYDRLFESHAEVSEEAIKKLCKAIEKYNKKNEVSTENLSGWGLIRKEENKYFPSVAFRLLAANDFLSAKIQCGLFKGTDKVFFIDRKEFDGPIFEQIENAYSFVMQHINLGAKIEGLYRQDIPEIPEAAIRELIVNAVLHRNYLAHSCVQICIFDDRLEITNPGGLYAGLTIEKMLSGSSSIRNELIADIFLKMNIVEKWGTGIKRVTALCKEYGLGNVEYKADEESFTATIRRRKKEVFEKNDLQHKVPFSSDVTLNGGIKRDSGGINGGLKVDSGELNGGIKLSDSEILVINEMKVNSFIKNEELTINTGLSSRTIDRCIKSLKEKGLITRDGSKKTGRWVVRD